jgi:hypothetical protein
MRALSGISRRRMLAMSAAAAGLAIGDGVRGASAQAATRIEQFAPELDKIISTSEPIRELATGTGGPSGLPKDRCGGRKAAISCTALFITTGA